MKTLKRRADYLKLKNGRRWTCSAFILQAQPRDEPADSSEPRFGFTVSNRAIEVLQPDGRKRGGAVKRNRARRRLKEAVRLTAADVALPGYDYVIIGRMAALDQNFTELLADMKRAFHKVHGTRAGFVAPQRGDHPESLPKAPG